ncbi:hypothetical protein ACP70R_022678 [Stipagrostis hirtigluma subsp. patula]
MDNTDIECKLKSILVALLANNALVGRRQFDAGEKLKTQLLRPEALCRKSV